MTWVQTVFISRFWENWKSCNCGWTRSSVSTQVWVKPQRKGVGVMGYINTLHLHLLHLSDALLFKYSSKAPENDSVRFSLSWGPRTLACKILFTVFFVMWAHRCAVVTKQAQNLNTQEKYIRNQQQDIPCDFSWFYLTPFTNLYTPRPTLCRKFVHGKWSIKWM